MELKTNIEIDNMKSLINKLKEIEGTMSNSKFYQGWGEFMNSKSITLESFTQIPKSIVLELDKMGVQIAGLKDNDTGEVVTFCLMFPKSVDINVSNKISISIAESLMARPDDIEVNGDKISPSISEYDSINDLLNDMNNFEFYGGPQDLMSYNVYFYEFE